MGGCVLAMKIETLKGGGGPGACSPGKILEVMNCLAQHFESFHGGEREKENAK